MSFAEPVDKNLLWQQGQGPASDGPTTGAGENFGAVFDRVRTSDNPLSLEHATNEHLQRRDDMIYQLTGKRLGVYDMDPFQAFHGTASVQRKATNAIRVEQQILELKKQYPQIRSRGEVMDDIKAERDKYRAIEQDVGNRAAVAGTIGGFAGGMVASLDPVTNPIAFATLPIGGFGKSIASRVVTEALTQMSIVAVEQAFVAQDYKKVGETLTPEQMGENILMVGAGSGAFRAAGEGIGAGIRALRARAEIKDATGNLAKDLTEAATPQERAAVIQQAQPEQLVELNNLINPVQSAEQRGILQAAETDNLVAKDNPFSDSGAINATKEHEKMLNEVGAAVERGDPLPSTENLMPSLINDVYKKVPVETFNVRDLTVDAKAMQFKGGGDANGVTDRLKGTKEWSDYLAGVVTVWKKEDGTIVVADGHQRVGFAKRLIAENPDKQINIPAFVFKEADGDTQEFVKAAAALRNISEGSGTALDASKVFKDMPSKAKAVFDSLPPNSQIVKQGQDLAKLDNEAYLMVINGVVDEKIAAVVGRLEDNHDSQRALMSLLAKEDPDTVFQAEQIVRQAQLAGFDTAEQATLFGTESITESLFKDKAKVLERGLRAIKDDVKTFRNLLSKGDRIEGVGNQLDQTANAAILGDSNTILQTVQALAYRKGPISDLLTQAAREAKANGRYKQAAERFVAALRSRLDEGGVSKLFDGTEGDISASIAEIHRRIASEKLDNNIAATADLFDEQPKNVVDGFNQLKIARDLQETPAAKSSGPDAGVAPAKTPKGDSGEATQALPLESQRTARKPSPDFSTANIAPETLTGGKAKLGMVDPSDGKRVYHVENDKATLMHKAQKYVGPLNDFMREGLDGMRGVKFLEARVKDVTQVDRKIAMLGRRADQVSDYLGARVQVDSIAAAREAQARLAELGRVVEVDDFLETPRAGSAYHAIHVQMMAKDGFTYEVQIIPRDLMDVYDEARRPYAKYKKDKVSGDQEAQYIKEVQAGNEIFHKAWQKFQERDLIDKQIREFDVNSEIPVSIDFDNMGNEIVRTQKLGDIMKEIESHENLFEHMTKCLV